MRQEAAGRDGARPINLRPWNVKYLSEPPTKSSVSSIIDVAKKRGKKKEAIDQRSRVWLSQKLKVLERSPFESFSIKQEFPNSEPLGQR